MARKTPTLAARIEATSTKKAAALATFENAALALEAAAAEHTALADEAYSESVRLTVLRDQADAEAEAARRAAAKVRDLFA